MWKGYETRERTVAKREIPPYASINARGEIALNRTALGLLHGAINVVLYYDPALKRIGIRGATQQDHDQHVFCARPYGRRGRMRVLRAHRFLRKFGVRIERILRFTNITTEPGPMLVLDLSKAVPAGSKIAALQV
jgi:hypothetical protein